MPWSALLAPKALLLWAYIYRTLDRRNMTQASTNSSADDSRAHSCSCLRTANEKLETHAHPTEAIRPPAKKMNQLETWTHKKKEKVC